MIENYTRVFDDHIAAIAKVLPAHTSESIHAAFLSQFFAKVPLTDMEKMDAQQAANIVNSAYAFLQERTVGKPKIQIFSQGDFGSEKNAHRQIIQLLNDDMPFLVDSLTTELTRQGYNIYATLHPMLHVKRNAQGKLESIITEEEAHQLRGSAAGNSVLKESFIHFEISPLPEGTSRESLIHDLEHILHNVLLTVTDWSAMMRKARDIKDAITAVSSRFDDAEIQEVTDFVDWLMDKNFVFLGYREHDFTTEDGHQRLAVVDGSPLGIFKGEGGAVKHRGHASLNVEECRFFQEPALVEITKSDHRSIIHRSVPMDYVGFKRFDAMGNVIGESRFLGLFTSVVYYQSALSIPFIRRKITNTLERANFDPASHNGKSLRAILEFFPRDELFQISEDELYFCSQGIMSLEAQPDVRVFIRRDPYERFVSALVYAPRDRFSTYVRNQIEKLMESALRGKVTGYNTQITDAPLARLQLIIKTNPGTTAEVNIKLIEESIRRLTSFWNDSLREHLLETQGEKQGELDFRVFRDAFPKNYCNYYHAREAVEDIQKIRTLEQGVDPSVRLMVEENLGAGRFRVKMFTSNQSAALSDMLPILENMGCRVLDVHPFDLTPNWDHDEAIILKDFALTVAGEPIKPLKESALAFEETLLEVWNGRAENDGYNALVLYAGLSCRQVTLLRAYGKYLKQVGMPYNDRYVAQALCNHPAITALLVALFETRFTPETDASREQKMLDIRKEIDMALSLVKNLAEDRIIRRFADTMTATLRTNYFQRDAQGNLKTYISFKLDSKNVPDLPLPKPHAEIFVYSTRTEGIHLRGGKVARGGLRWSDRHEDFRTEVLGLVKAQMVKNAVIVPVGSKGGFIVKNPPATGGRDAFMAEGIACYRQFLMGLLDITDNINGSAS
jgi:glutamate dehydrogenase